jgi:hypothetical protein
VRWTLAGPVADIGFFVLGLLSYPATWLVIAALAARWL